MNRPRVIAVWGIRRSGRSHTAKEILKECPPAYTLAENLDTWPRNTVLDLLTMCQQGQGCLIYTYLAHEKERLPKELADLTDVVIYTRNHEGFERFVQKGFGHVLFPPTPVTEVDRKHLVETVSARL